MKNYCNVIILVSSRNGPDWKSRLKYLPDPSDDKYPAAEIFPNNWKAMRPYPCNISLSSMSISPNTGESVFTINKWLVHAVYCTLYNIKVISVIDIIIINV